MLNTFLIILIALSVANLLVLLLKKQDKTDLSKLDKIEDDLIRFDSRLENTEKSIKDEFQRNRSESNQIATGNREELSKSLNDFSTRFEKNVKELNTLLKENFTEFNKQQRENSKQSTENLKEVRLSVERQLNSIREDNTRQLEEMRKTVDEKLQKTLNERLSQSFETVGKQLQAVQEGLGEMKTLATDVGGLKKVLSNVKMRGGIGEIQLSMLLEQILAPDQYEANVKTKASSNDLVEFAIKLPGQDEDGTHVWLPIDAKFPKDIYEQLQDAYDVGEPEQIATAQKIMDNTIKKMAKDISEKYLDPPGTTDFGIMFLPFEGIYAEVVRKAALLEELQVKYKIIVTGPTTLAAILNSLQMGFKTLAIQKRSSEVWQVLGAVKKEFGNFSGMMEKAQRNIQTGMNQLDEVMGKRTRAIQRKLKNVEELDESEAQKILPGISESEIYPEDE
ncbi:MAG: DNA recombination protein RmuC [Bacteroidota bacterium]|nr:DNA recombination protein RmuC [Bacteroidota bacterium]